MTGSTRAPIGQSVLHGAKTCRLSYERVSLVSRVYRFMFRLANKEEIDARGVGGFSSPPPAPPLTATQY
jgi:hypothetical protein